MQQPDKWILLETLSRGWHDHPKNIASSACNGGCVSKLEFLCRLVDEPAVIHSRQIEGQMTTTLSGEIEPFVDANRAAEFLVITRRRVLEMARAGEIPAHAIGERRRKMWRFRPSELADAFVAKSAVAKSGSKVSSTPAVPGNRVGGTR